MANTILLLDPDVLAFGELPEALQAAGHELVCLEDVERAAELLAEGAIDLVLVEARAASLLAELGVLDEAGPTWIAFDTFGNLSGASGAHARGAFAVLGRPAPLEEAQRTVERALQAHRLEQENRRLRAGRGTEFRLGGLVSRDPRCGELFELARRVAASATTLLVTGESGVGKSRLAAAVHGLSPRAGRPFVEVNCGALAENLLESELFGHAAGSFTGARTAAEGKFESADEGTLFLDEIGTASPALQVKLLRFLETRAFERVGESKTRTADVRVIAATNVDLRSEVEAGRFREDLFWRLEVIGLELPPLRERPLDVQLLLEHFLEEFADLGSDAATIQPAALSRFFAHDWPGNVRELRHAVERGVLLAGGAPIGPEHLPPALGEGSARVPRRGLPPVPPTAHTPPPGAPAPAAAPTTRELVDPATPVAGWETTPLGPLREMLEGPERRFVERALEACGGSRKRTAELLDVNRSTLFNKMRKFGLLSSGSEGSGA